MSMKKVAVTVYEVHASTYVVEVEDETIEDSFYFWNLHEKAIEQVQELIEAGDEPVSFDYSHTLDPDQWKTFVVDVVDN